MGGGGYSDHFKHYLIWNKGDESDPITFRKYIANMTVSTGKYARDQLFHAIPRNNNFTTVHFMFFLHHKVKKKQVLNRLPFILSEEIPVNPNYFINRSGINIATMGIWDKAKCAFTNPDDLHNEEAKESMFEVTGLMSLSLDQDPQATLENQIGNFDELDLQKFYAHAQEKDDETLTIASRSHQIGRKFQEQANTVSTPGLNIAHVDDVSITSGLTRDADADDDASLLGEDPLIFTQ